MKPAISKLICILLFLIMCSTLVVSPTLARYVTNTELTDEARVSKWGVTVSYPRTITTMFPKAYYGNEWETASAKNRYASAGYTDDSVTVKSDVDIVAPGTWGYFPYPIVNGTPEVAIRTSFKSNLDLGKNWKAENGEEYCPVIFRIDYGAFVKINGKQATDIFLYIGGKTRDGKEITTIDELEQAVEEAVSSAYAEYEPNVDLTARYNPNSTDTTTYGQRASIRVFWAWPFSATGNNFGTGSLKNLNEKDLSDATKNDAKVAITLDNEKDTYLCNLAANDNTKDDPTITLTTSCTIEQID